MKIRFGNALRDIDIKGRHRRISISCYTDLGCIRKIWTCTIHQLSKLDFRTEESVILARVLTAQHHVSLDIFQKRISVPLKLFSIPREDMQGFNALLKGV